MALRTENGWYQVGADACEWATVPGTRVTLQIQKGWPLAILRAFAADFNAFVEPLRDPDSACWTPTNSVATSNHLSGTAMDLNWNSHPFKVLNAGFNSQQIATIRELLAFYEDTVWWGNDWNSPKDAMHFQMNGDTYNNQHTADFVAKKVRADGYSTFRRGNTVETPAAPSELTVPLVQKPNGRWGSPSPAWDHLIVRESGGNPTIIQQIHDVNSGGNEAEGLFQITPRTWRAHNGTEFAPSARFATPQQQAIVAARIFTRNPSGSDWGAGLPGREDAKQLAAGLVPTQTQGEDDFLMALSADEQQRLLARTDQIWGALFNEVQSDSPYAKTGGDPIKTKDFIRFIDGATHALSVESGARLGHPTNIDQIASAAAAGNKRAQLALADLEANYPSVLQNYLALKGARQ